MAVVSVTGNAIEGSITVACSWRWMGYDMHELIDSDSLTLEQIPSSDGSWSEISRFAHTFNGYEFHGSFEKCAEVAHSENLNTLDELRTGLFFLLRSIRHGGEGPSDSDLEFARNLIGRIRQKVEQRK